MILFFFGVELTSKSVILALLASITQFFQAKLLLPKNTKNKPEKGSMEEIMQNVQTQMVYFIPIIILFVSYTFGAIIALYFITSNIFSIIQEYYLKKTIKKDDGVLKPEKIS